LSFFSFFPDEEYDPFSGILRDRQSVLLQGHPREELHDVGHLGAELGGARGLKQKENTLMYRERERERERETEKEREIERGTQRERK
jgi:hypothetical protein